MFGASNRTRAENAEAELIFVKMRLAQYDELFKKLKKHDHFKFTSGGGIVAYNKDEPDNYGTGYIVPEECIKMSFV
jgi:hypothetical protein